LTERKRGNVPWICIKCGYKANDYPGEECPECKGLMEEREVEIDWEGEGNDAKKDKDDDIVM